MFDVEKIRTYRANTESLPCRFKKCITKSPSFCLTSITAQNFTRDTLYLSTDCRCWRRSVNTGRALLVWPSTCLMLRPNSSCATLRPLKSSKTARMWAIISFIRRVSSTLSIWYAMWRSTMSTHRTFF